MMSNWVFDAKVAERFDREARTHIPDYEDVVAKSAAIAVQNFPDRSARIIDVGSALGHTLEVLRANGFTDVHGVDNAEAMLEHSRVRENLIHADTFPVESGPFDMVVANWTLHFVRTQEERRGYLRDIFSGLKTGGILFLTEKIDAGASAHDEYLNFKRSAGVSEREIAEKTNSLVGVLNPFPASWYHETLHDIGFSKIDTAHEIYCFKTFLCIRS